jgi:hypothetical protein
VGEREVAQAEEAAILRPGDTLVIRASAANPQQLEELCDTLRERLPESIKLAVIAGIDQLLVYKP